MKLRSALSRQPLPALQKLAANVGITDPPKGKAALIDELCRSLPSADGVAERLGELDREARRFTTFLAAEGGELLWTDARREGGKDFDLRLDAILRELTAAGLVFQESESSNGGRLVGIPEPILKVIPLPESQRGRLRSIMQDMSIGLLRTFAQESGIPTDSGSATHLIADIRTYLLNLDNLKSFLAAQTEEKRAILDLFLKGKALSPADVVAQLGEPVARDFEELRWKTPLFYVPDKLRNQADAPVRLAADLQDAMKRLARRQGGRLESRPEEALHEEMSPPSDVMDNLPSLLQDLATVIATIDRKRPRVLKKGGIAKAELREVKGVCRGDHDPGYPLFLMLFAEGAGLVTVQSGAWRLAPDAGKILSRDTRVVRDVYAFWQETDYWNEWTEDRPGSDSKQARMDELKTLRAEILEGLRRCPEDQWVSYTSFYEHLIKSSEAFQAHAEHPGSGRSLASGGTTADELLRRMLRGALYWLGVVRLGAPSAFSKPLARAGKAAFQVTKAGASLLHRGKASVIKDALPTSSKNARVVIQPNLEILSPPDLPLSRYLTLFSFSDLVSVDVMAHFRLSRESLQEALNQDLSPGEIRSFLKRNSATGIPHMAEELIRDCERKHGEIDIVPAAGYLTVNQSDLLDELYAQKGVADRLGDRLSSKIAALKPEASVDQLMQALSRQGYMPSLSEDTREAGEGYHPLMLRTADLAELVGFVEAADAALREVLGKRYARRDVASVARKLRRQLRKAPSAPVKEAREHAAEAFAALAETPAEKRIQAVKEYEGKDPASKAGDIRELIGYALDNGLCLVIDYNASDDEKSGKRIVEPISEDHAMLFAYCRDRKGDRVFRIASIKSATLTPEQIRTS